VATDFDNAIKTGAVLLMAFTKWCSWWFSFESWTGLTCCGVCVFVENNPLSLIPKPYRQVEIKYSKLGKGISHP